MMKQETQKPSRFQIWQLAARPRTLPAAVAPVIMGSAVAYHDETFLLLPALAALLGALLLQVGANLANDVFDFHRGADTQARLGPLRVTQAGLLTPAEVLRGMWLVFGLAALLGIYLAWVGGWPVIIIGLASILAAIAYTGGPLPFGYYGLGDFFSFLFFGPVAVVGTYYVQAKTTTWLAWLVSLAIGLLVMAILVVNNLRDIETDRAAGKHTLAVRLGVQGTRLEYVLCLAAAFSVPTLVAAFGFTSWGSLLAWLALPLAGRLARQIYRATGKALNPSLAGTGQLALLFAALCGLGIVLWP
jgi:1,4-dihydroxy-2-naphthoate octaprenyltransferase